MKLKNTLILIFIFVFVYCSVDKREDDLIVIDFEANINNFKKISLSEICEDVEYISLETNDSCLINRIKYLDISSNYILVFDWEKCLLFNRSGTFITQIGKKGRGPGEYSHPGQIRIINNKILIPDAGNNVIHIYDIKGNFIENVKSPGQFSNQIQVNNYFPITDSLFLVQIPNLTGREKNRISMINRNGETLITYSNTTFFNREKPKFYSSDLAAQFYSFNNKIRYKEQLIDTVWQIEEKKLLPIYVLNRGRFGTPNEIRELPAKDFISKISNSIFIDNIYETNRFLVLKTNFMKYYPFDFFRNDLERKSPHSIIGLYEKLEGKFFFVEPNNIKEQVYPTGFENDIDGGVNLMPEYLFEDTLFVSWINSFELKNYFDSGTFKNSTPKFPEKKKALEKLANSLNENDNPVLMLVKLKK